MTDSEQRRENVRVNVMTPARLFNKHEREFKATTLDLSAGGFRASVPGGVWVDEHYAVEIDLPSGGIVKAVALAKRRVTEHHVSFAFTEISNRDRERIIAEVFRLQRLAISRGVRL